MTPSSGAINLLEWLTELRKTFYVLDYWFIIEGYSAGTAKWKRHIGQGTWEGEQSFQALPGNPPFQNLHVFTHQDALRPLYFRDFYGGFIM